MTSGNNDDEDPGNGTVVSGLGWNVTKDLEALLLPLNVWTVPVNGYISPVLVLFTLTTNAVVCAVLLRPGMRTPTNTLLVAMAVSDTLTGISPIPVYLYFYTWGRYEDWVPYHWCFLYFCLSEHLPTIFHTASVWLTVALGIQRYICVCRSHEMRQRCTIRATLITIVTIYIIVIISQLSRFIESTYEPVIVESLVTPNHTVLTCQQHFAEWVLRHEDVYFNTYYWFRVVCIHLIPCTTLVAVNAALINAMRRASRRRRQLLAYAAGGGPRRRSECRRLADSNVTTAMLVVVVGVFLVVEFPLAILFVVVIVQNSLRVEIIGAEMGDTATVFINLLILLSYSANFFIYCAMSAQFRVTLIETFSRRRTSTFTTADDGASKLVSSMVPRNTVAVNPDGLQLSTIDDYRRTETRTADDTGCDVIAEAEADCSSKTPSIPLDDIALL